MPEKTLEAFADQGQIGTILTRDERADDILMQFRKSGIDIDSLGAQLQDDGTKSFVKSWEELMDVISSKCIELRKAS
jgi:transaldolase